MSFSAGISAIFTDPNLSQPATYTPPGGEAVAVRVVEHTPPDSPGEMFTDYRQIRYGIDVRVSDVATPAEGAALTIGSNHFTVRGWQRTLDKLVWRLDVEKQP